MVYSRQVYSRDISRVYYRNISRVYSRDIQCRNMCSPRLQSKWRTLVTESFYSSTHPFSCAYNIIYLWQSTSWMVYCKAKMAHKKWENKVVMAASTRDYLCCASFCKIAYAKRRKDRKNKRFLPQTFLVGSLRSDVAELFFFLFSLQNRR